jgi:hypothetical protein
MADRSSRPHHSPRRTPAPVVRQIVHLRWTQRLGPAQIASRVGLAASTVHAVLVRCRISRLRHLDRATGQPIRRYEHPIPAPWSTSTSSSWATSRLGAATGSSAAPPASPTARLIGQAASGAATAIR